MQQVKVCLGRFQPFHKGHLKMATYKDLKGPDNEQKESLREQPDLKEIVKQKTVIFVIYIDDAKVDDKHPFTHADMEKEMNFVKKNYKDDIEDIFFVKSADICAWGEILKEKGYQASVWLTGSDEYKMYKSMAIKVPQYEEKNRDNRDFKDACSKSFYVEEIERTNDADFVSSISGTKVRQALFDDDKEYFKKAMPKGCDSLFDEFKEKLLKAPKAPEKKVKKKVKEGMKSLSKFLFESISKSLTCFDNDHPRQKDIEINKYDKQPTEDTLFDDIVKCLSNKIKWFDKDWLSKNEDVEEEIYELIDELLTKGESRFIYTYKFYLK